uniref:Uncharacterized protein n=1 Tax=Anopheles maculatus TaxID=74869 RepID=A0A182T6Z6_9DIPT
MWIKRPLAWESSQVYMNDEDTVKETTVHAPKQSSAGAAQAAKEPGDIQMHIHSDHGTGGHWCAKVVFFILLAGLGALIGLILMESQGVSNDDTPLSWHALGANDKINIVVDDNDDDDDDDGDDKNEETNDVQDNDDDNDEDDKNDNDQDDADDNNDDKEDADDDDDDDGNWIGAYSCF